MPLRPEDLGRSSDRLARIDRHLQERYVGPGKIAGCHTFDFRGQLQAIVYGALED